MAVAAKSPATMGTGLAGWTVVRPLVICLAVVTVSAALGLTAWVRASPPVSHGSVVAGLGEGHACDPTSFGGHESITCFEVPFAEGAGVGIGFTIRNTAPIPMTIVRVHSYGPPYILPAYLHPELIDEEYLYGLDVGRPFEPIEVGPNQEVPMQLVGTYRNCETVATFQQPGSAVVIDRAEMTLRWAFVDTEVRLPLGIALSLPGPSRCPNS